MKDLDLDMFAMHETILSFESFKLKKQYMLKEMASKPIDLEPRPNRMKKPPEMNGVATNPTSYFQDLYIQDEMRHMLIDKYGREKGEKSFDGLIDAMSSRPGAFFQQGGVIAAEKAWLINNTGKPNEPGRHDYWKYSYYEMWKQWMTDIGQNINIASPVTATPVSRQEPVVAARPTPATQQTDDIRTRINRAFDALTGKGASNVEKSKSRARIDNIINGNNPLGAARKMVGATGEVYKLVQRAYFAQEAGNSDIAKMFWDKAVSLGVRESIDGKFTGLDIINENSNRVGDDTWNYHLSDDGGVSTEWDIPMKLEIGTEFTHTFGRYMVSSIEDTEIYCDRM